MSLTIQIWCQDPWDKTRQYIGIWGENEINLVWSSVWMTLLQAFGKDMNRLSYILDGIQLQNETTFWVTVDLV